MKRSFALMIAILCIASRSPAANISYTATFSENDFTFRQENGYDVVEYPECDRYGDVGAPQVLVTYLSFIIPQDQTVQSITINGVKDNQFPGTYDMFPVQPEDYYKLCCDSEMPDWVDQNPKYYGSPDPYPADVVVLDQTGFFDGANHIATVKIFPVYYIGQDSTLFCRTKVSFTLNIGGISGDSPIEVQIRMREDQAVYDDILANAVKNPQDIPIYGYTPPLSDTSIASDVPQYPTFPFLVVTRDSLRDYWNPFVDWLNRKGQRAGILSIETIVGYGMVDDPGIGDHADLLRGYLKYAYQHGMVWVILGGVCEPKIHANIFSDYVNVPMRYVIDPAFDPEWVDVSCAWYERHRWVPADIYFSDLTTDWEIDGDGVPGEKNSPNPPPPALPGDLNSHIDNGEELFLGRVPVINGEDIINWTAKIMNYEQNPGNGDYGYLLDAYWNLADQCQDVHEEDQGIPYFPGGFSHNIQREVPTGSDPSPTAPTGDLVIDQMSSWPAFINWHHHGDITVAHVRTGGYNADYLNRLTAHHDVGCFGADTHCSMDDLTNSEKPGFTFSVDCAVADFACPYETPARDRCIGCNFSLTENGGAGFIGNSRTGWVSGSAGRKRHFLEHVFDSSPHKIGPAKVYMISQTSAITYLMNFTLFGSPDQLIWSDIPLHLAVDPDYLSDAVTVTSGGNPVEGAVVCFASRDLSKYYLATTDVNGYAEVDPGYDFDVTIETNITVTKHNYIPYQIIGAGDIEMDMVWRGDIAFYGIVNIPSGKSLVVKPGATIRTDSEVIVFGKLKIEGDANHHVILTSAEETPAAGDWSGMRIDAGGSLDMSYCDLEYAYNGIVADGASSFLARYSTIKHWVTYGIQCTDVSEPTIEFCLFEFGGLKAIDIIGGRPVISSNKIIGTDFAITYQGDDTVRIEANILEGLLTSQTGIKVTRYDVGDAPIPYVVNNIDTLYNYGMLLLYCPDDPAVVIKGNEVRKHRFAGVVLNDDAPIIGGTYASGEYNQFSDNDKWGIYVGNGSPVIRENAIKRNGQYAVRAFFGADPNLGDETIPGNNSIWGYIYDGHNSSLNTIMAVGNWWNTTGIPNVYGNWNTSDPLSFDPYLWAKPETELSEIPKEFKLNVNYPNPFNPATTISFDLPKPQAVKIEIFNLLGQKVITLTDFLFDAGVHSVTWDGRDDKGTEVGSGIYFYRFSSEDYMDSKKMTLIK